MGFYSIELLKRENALKQIKDTDEFKLLLKQAKKNALKRTSLRRMLYNEEYLYYRNKPYGMSKKLQVAAYYERTRRYEKAEEILLSQIKDKIPFRDKSIALFSISRIFAKKGNKKMAKKYINRFIKHLSSAEKVRTGYKKLMQYFFEDIIRNDKYLKNL